jgi:hypothetical protein
LSQPVIEGSGEEPTPGSGAPLKPGEFILGYPDEHGPPANLPEPEVLSRNGRAVGASTHSFAAAAGGGRHPYDQAGALSVGAARSLDELARRPWVTRSLRPTATNTLQEP